MAAPAGNGMYVVTQYIPSVAFHPAQQGVSPCQMPSFLKRFIEGEPKTLGAIQILIGILQICLGAILISITGGSIIIYSGVPFSASIFYIISGALSVAAERNGTRSLVKGSLGMNVVSIIFAGAEIIIVPIDLADSSFGCRYELCSVRQALGSLLLILTILEFCLAFSTFVFGCKSVCCSGSTVETQPILAVPNH